MFLHTANTKCVSPVVINGDGMILKSKRNMNGGGDEREEGKGGGRREE